MKKKEVQNFDVTKHIHFVSPFKENEVDKYFLLIEKVAKDLDWPLNKYTISSQSVLEGKASEVHIALKPKQTSDYQNVKETILKAYRQKFIERKIVKIDIILINFFMNDKIWTCLTLYHTVPTFNNPKEEGFGKKLGKEENAGN